MSRRGCDREKDVLGALLRDQWTEPLRRHLETCENCREMAAVSTWLRGVAREEVLGAPVPEASRIWWKAQLVQRVEGKQGLVRRAIQPIVLVERLATFVIAVALSVWAWSHRGSVTARIADTGLVDFRADPVTLAIALVGLLAIGSLATLHTIGWLREP